MKIKRLLLSMLVILMGITGAWAQGNNYGLGNSAEKEMASLSKRMLNLEERSKAFQVYLNFRAGMEENLDGENKGGHIRAHLIRPEFLGDLGKWGYRVRLDLCTGHEDINADGTNNVIDIAKIFYQSDHNWSFSIGKAPLNYGTFEYEWNPVNVLNYYEFQGLMPDAANVFASIDYNLRNQLFTFEVANANTLPALAASPTAQARFSPTTHPMQFSLSWRGNMFDNRLNTIWSYTLRNETKNSRTSLVMLGTSYKIGRVDLQLDYNGAFGKLDYLGLATNDAQNAGLIDKDGMVTDAKYHQWVVDIGYWPTKRWNLFTKLGISKTSSSAIEGLHNYRTTYEYSAAAQYFLDKSQEVCLSLSYYGKTIDFKKGFGLSDYNTNQLLLSLVCRLKIL